jgi:predicted dehydrogenase
MAHSYVRGNWRNSKEASPMILAKCSHDFDLLYWLLERRCTRLSSIGSLQHFRPEQAPEGAPYRCTDGCPVAENCPFEATNIYLNLQPFIAELKLASEPTYRFLGKLADNSLGRSVMNMATNLIPPLHQFRHYHIWPRSIVSDEPGEKAVREALQTGAYGRCVYHCDNDVVDHQVVMMEMEGGVSATLTMHGHSHQEGRTTRIDGTRATLFARMNLFDSEITLHHNRTRRTERFHIPHPFGFGHGGGDAGLMEAFAEALEKRQQQPLTNAQASLESHLLAFAAEEARVSGEVIDMETYRAQAWHEVSQEEPYTQLNGKREAL